MRTDYQPRRPRYRSLDMWRGVACLLVVVYHCPHSNWQRDASTLDHVAADVLALFHCGVPFFFVISGYCIAAAADAERRYGHGLLEYFRRRFYRIFPPYWIFLALTVPLAILVWWASAGTLLTDQEHPLSLTRWEWLGTLTLTETWRHYLIGSPGWRMFWGHAWTLCYEEQFYFVCGLLLLARRWFFQLAGTLTVAVALVSLFTFKKIGFETQGFFFDGYWLIFAAGLLLYYQNNYALRVWSQAITALFVAGAVGAVLFRLVVIPRLQVYESEILLATEMVFGACFALLLSLLRRWDDLLAASRLTTPLTWCGRMCYSLYLVHFPITLIIGRWLGGFGWQGFGTLLVTSILLGVALSLLGGWLFHLGVERYFLNAPLPSKKLAHEGVPA